MAVLKPLVKDGDIRGNMSPHTWRSAVVRLKGESKVNPGPMLEELRRPPLLLLL
jgi:hypothetical protein